MNERGISLIDTVVGIALMLVVFGGIASAFELGVDVVLNNKARAGAIALANQRMEYTRSLAYTSIGTVNGIPSGTIAQSETVKWNGVSYTRRTFIEYEDDSKDGSGAGDSNGIPEDYKSVKVDVSWSVRGATRHVMLVSRFSPSTGVETNPCGSPCGTLRISAVNASGTALPSATVSIVNASTSPTISINTFTDASGTVALLGAPASTGYQISVTEPGYSTAQTYSVSAQNTNPSPGNLTVSANQTTSGTFAIDSLGSKTIQTKLWANGQSATSVPSVAFSIKGAKTIGSGPSGTLYKYSNSFSTDANGTLTITNLEWDTYTLTVAGATGYDVASACNPQPESLSPGASQATTLYLSAHTTNSLLVDVHLLSTGALYPGALVRLSRTGFAASTSTDPCGQAFFSGLSSASDYQIDVGASGHATTTTTNVNVASTTRFSAQLN